MALPGFATSLSKSMPARAEMLKSPFARSVALVAAFGAPAAIAQDAAQERPAGFVDAATIVPGLVPEMRYATAHNFTGRPIDGYEARRCLLTKEAAEALASVARDLAPRGLVVKAFDCYRPTRAVENFIRWARDFNDQTARAEFYPNVDKRTLFRDGYIASHSGHSRGSTIDMTLVRADGAELDMGTPFRFLQSDIVDRRCECHGRAACQPHIAGRGDAPARLSQLREGMVALHADARAVPGHLFQFPGAVRGRLLPRRYSPR